MDENPQKTIDKKLPPANWKLFNLGFWLLMFSWSVMVLSKTRWHINAIYISAPLLCAGMYFLLSVSFQNLKSRIRQLDPAIQIVLPLLLIWGFLTALRGFSTFQPMAFRDNLGIRFFAWTWVVPTLVSLTVFPLVVPQLLKVMMKQGRLGVIILAIGWVPPVRLFTFFSLCWGCSALLLFWHYLSKGSRRIALIGSFLTILFAVLNSERNAIVGHGFLIIGASYIGMTRQGRFQRQRRFGIIIRFLVVLGLTYYVASRENIPFLGKKQEQRIQEFKDELFVNTRISKAGVSLYRDFLDDMEALDLIIGRGSLGTYRSMESGGIYRPIIECGYFQVILKGGIIMLILMLILAIPAVLKGFFASRNWVVKGFAFIVSGWLIEMIPFGVPAAFPRYVLFWLAVGVCLNPRLRMMTNRDIDRFLPEGAVGFGGNRKSIRSTHNQVVLSTGGYREKRNQF